MSISIILATLVSLGTAPQQPKFSLFAHDVIDSAKTSGYTLAETASKLKAAGISGFDAEYCEEQTIVKLKAQGLIPINFYGFMKFLAPDNGKAQAEAYVASAVRHGAPRIMVVPDFFSKGGDREAEYARMRDGLKALVAAAKAKNITTMIEDFGLGPNHPCNEVKYLRRFLNDIPDLYFAVDSGNLHYADHGEDIVAFAKELGMKRIRHVHLKDFDAVHSRNYVSLGTGVVPNAEIVKYVDGLGYDGWYTLENPVGENRLADAIRQSEWVKRQLKSSKKNK